VILCTGGKSLPKSGSDGSGFALATMLGHSITAPVVPALVPLVAPLGFLLARLALVTPRVLVGFAAVVPLATRPR